MTVYAPRGVCSITWNGEKTVIESSKSGMYVVSVDGPSASFELPTLGPWKSTNSLPEIADDYSPKSPAWVGT